jgi:hypothetical protein
MPASKYGQLRVQLFVIFASAALMLATAALHEYREVAGRLTYWRPIAAMCVFCIVASVWLAVAPKQRFSLRTLLIVTTLVAIALGLIAWLR